MTSFSIVLASVNDVKVFVEAASRYSSDIDVLSGRYVVDGKSIMGLFSINLAEPVTIQVHGSDEEAAALRADVAAYVAE